MYPRVPILSFTFHQNSALQTFIGLVLVDYIMFNFELPWLFGL